MKSFATISTLLALSSLCVAKPLITCEPRELGGLPGEPLQVTVTVETDRAAPIQLKIPAFSHLVLRTVETVPIRRTESGRYIQQRIIIWQGLEAANRSLTNLTVSVRALESRPNGDSASFQPREKHSSNDSTSKKQNESLTQAVPDITLRIEEVPPAKPPEKTKEGVE